MRFDTFGQRVLDNAWNGFHCCLFAYGQTGAGKSYSMVGYGNNKGIVPISCEARQGHRKPSKIFKAFRRRSSAGLRARRTLPNGAWAGRGLTLMG